MQLTISQYIFLQCIQFFPNPTCDFCFLFFRLFFLVTNNNEYQFSGKQSHGHIHEHMDSSSHTHFHKHKTYAHTKNSQRRTIHEHM